MPLEGLPKPLENLMDTFLKQNTLSSLHVKGGPYFTQICLRFPNDNMTENSGELKYRRAPPSRICRDTNRARNRQQTHTDITTTAVITEDVPHSMDMCTNKPLEEKDNVSITNPEGCSVTIHSPPVENTIVIHGVEDQSCGTNPAVTNLASQGSAAAIAIHGLEDQSCGTNSVVTSPASHNSTAITLIRDNKERDSAKNSDSEGDDDNDDYENNS